ncbi:LADA_0H13630g1_1 [Lachancea dasiensis]|uniref:LADA_0H13630g1_1 n=1 Tax=Lachancea dasiensis TaxID=1072105 RepID=A0A1G4K471_9SACH|nr:LADA_0H13630g1_1 [Lachancea dasiensis]
MPPHIEFEINPPINGDCFVSNEPIRGFVVLKLKGPTSIVAISIELRGTAQTQTNDCSIRTPSGTKSYHTLVHLKQELFPASSVRNSAMDPNRGFQMSGGEHRFCFEFLIPNRPKCVGDHGMALAGFTRDQEEEDLRLPPSFNSGDYNQGLARCMNSFYKSSAISYYLKAAVEIRRPRFPMRDNTCVAWEFQGFNYMPRQLPDSSVTMRTSPGLCSVFRSKRCLEMGVDFRAWIEIRASSLDRVFRLDKIFQPGSGKLDDITLVVNKYPMTATEFEIKKLKLGLMQVLSCYPLGRNNRTTEYIPLLETDLSLRLSIPQRTAEAGGVIELPLRLQRAGKLAGYKFNEKNMSYGENRLYSFTTCNIKREFKFSVAITVEADGREAELEVLTNFCHIEYFSAMGIEELPKYGMIDIPPAYSNG